MDWLATHQFTLIGIIFMLVIGPAVGNYACSVVYRLPRGKTPFERHPFCGHCNADLKPIDLFPIISWLMTRGKCRYCAGPIPAIYTVIEILCGVIFVAYFLHFGMSELFLIYAAYATFVVILAAIHWQQGWISSTIYSYAFAMIMLARTLTEHTIYGVIQSSVVMLLLVLALYKLAGNKQPPFEKPWIWWFVLMGALLPIPLWYFIVPIFVMKLLVPKEARVIVYTAGALTLPLILPSLT
jgi:prepilin signal peptidase PulO-like enzyme (type II secretory pathway)